MNAWLKLRQERSVFRARLRPTTLCLLGALALLVLIKGPPAYAQQVTSVPPFIGTHSETWERFGVAQLPSGTSMLAAIATLPGEHMETATSFQTCSVSGRPS